MQPQSQHSSADLKLLVHNARLELAAILSTLKQVLNHVATGEQHADKADRPATSQATANGPTPSAPVPPQQPQPNTLQDTHTLEPVLKRFDTLKKAVSTAVSMHATIVAKAQQEENQVSPQQRARLAEQRRALVDEICVKNDKIKLLIDQLRDLHRDITVLLNPYFNTASNRQKVQR